MGIITGHSFLLLDAWFSMTYDQQVIELPFSFIYSVTNATKNFEPKLIA